MNTNLSPKKTIHDQLQSLKTIFYNKAGLEQEELSFADWMGRFCLNDCWAGQNLSWFHNQLSSHQALLLFICWVVIQPHKVLCNTDLVQGSCPDSQVLKGGCYHQKWQGPSKDNRSIVLSSVVHMSRKLVVIGDRMIQWRFQAATFCCSWGTYDVCTGFLGAQIFPPIVEQEVNHQMAQAGSHSHYSCVPQKYAQKSTSTVELNVTERSSVAGWFIEVTARGILLTHNSNYTAPQTHTINLLTILRKSRC